MWRRPVYQTYSRTEQYPTQTRDQKRLREDRQKSHVQRLHNVAVQGHPPSRARAKPHVNATSGSYHSGHLEHPEDIPMRHAVTVENISAEQE